MHRITVYRSTQGSTEQVNMNDEVGLEAHSSYGILAHLEDLSDSGISVTKRVGNCFELSDGTHCKLVECIERVDESQLDEATRLLIAFHDAQDSVVLDAGFLAAERSLSLRGA